MRAVPGLAILAAALATVPHREAYGMMITVQLDRKAEFATRARRFVEALWTLDVPSSRVFRYYDGLLYLMSLLHASGRFRVIPPGR